MKKNFAIKSQQTLAKLVQSNNFLAKGEIKNVLQLTSADAFAKSCLSISITPA